MMIRLIYASLAHERSREIEIDRIVSVSAIHNAAADITGVLAFNGSRIVQILEGPTRAVGELFGRILIDHRHNSVVELVNVRIETHTFETWGMVRRPISEVMLAVENLR
jgi:hypothetical protein